MSFTRSRSQLTSSPTIHGFDPFDSLSAVLYARQYLNYTPTVRHGLLHIQCAKDVFNLSSFFSSYHWWRNGILLKYEDWTMGHRAKILYVWIGKTNGAYHLSISSDKWLNYHSKSRNKEARRHFFKIQVINKEQIAGSVRYCMKLWVLSFVLP